MTRYSRSVIPGRQAGEAAGGATDMDRLVFGTKVRHHDDAANDEDDADEMSEPEINVLVDRANGDRRRGQRRRKSDKSDYAPLPGEERRSRGLEGSTRGPLILAGALVIVAVFGVVVWNAYRDGVRTEDSGAAPVLADSGAFKRPADVKAKEIAAAEDSVFDQVEAKPTVAPAPEVRTQAVAPAVQAAPPPAVKAAETKPAVTKAAEVKPSVTKPAETKPAEVKTAAATPAPPKAVTPAPVAATTAAAVVPPPAPLKTPAAAAPAQELAGGFKPVFAKDGKYVVQIGAPSTEAAANADWDRRAKTAPELFSAAERLIQRADVNGKTVYRVRAGSFATGADADSFCNAFKAKGGQCYRAAK